MSPRARVLADGIKNHLIGIQKAQQIYKDLSKLEKKVLKMTEDQVDNTSIQIALAVDNWYEGRLQISRTPSPEEVGERIAQELKNFSE